MKTDERSASAEKELLCEERRELLGEIAIYRLIRKKGAFSVRIEYREDYAQCVLGEDEDKARRVFTKISEGTVTPCTLEYIAAELL